MFRRTLLVTHNSRFHSDDVFATAALLILLKNRGIPRWRIHIRRERDPKWFKAGDFVYDVGTEYDPERNRFDHHQEGGAGTRENGVPYAAFGLVWKKYGREICGNERIAHMIDKKLVEPIDALDNAYPIYSLKNPDIAPYIVQDAISSFYLSWKESPSDLSRLFKKAVGIAQSVLEREIKKSHDQVEAEELVKKAYEQTEDKRLIILNENYPYETFLSSVPEPLLVVYPVRNHKGWKVETISKDYRSYTYENRIMLPASWAGKRDAELVTVTGVADAVFCHNGRFLIVAKSKEGALALAKKALEG